MVLVPEWPTKRHEGHGIPPVHVARVLTASELAFDLDPDPRLSEGHDSIERRVQAGERRERTSEAVARDESGLARSGLDQVGLDAGP